MTKMDSDYSINRNKEIDKAVYEIIGDRRLDALDEAVIRIRVAAEWDRKHRQEGK